MKWDSARFNYLGYSLRAGFADEEAKRPRLTLHLALKNPYSSAGFRHSVYASSLAVEWVTGKSGLRGYGGAGLGAYVEVLNSTMAFVPAPAFHGGIRAGGASIGVYAELDYYLGIFKTDLLARGIAWNLIQMTGGLYVGI